MGPKCGLCSSSALLDANPLRPHQINPPQKNVWKRAYANLVIKISCTRELLSSAFQIKFRSENFLKVLRGVKGIFFISGKMAKPSLIRKRNWTNTCAPFRRLCHPNHASALVHVLVFAVCLVFVYTFKKSFVLACS